MLKRIPLLLQIGFIFLIGAADPCLAVGARASAAEVAELVSPIALYPDPLLQYILPAATFPDQIADAALLIRTKADAALIAEQSWDGSVKVIAGYPGVLKMMYERLDWTTELGTAFLDQHEVVLDAIQELRAKAKAVGNLESSEAQKVSQTTTANGDTIIVIEPADPQVIYVPQQTAPVVYTEHHDDSSDFWMPVATFGLGMAIGAAMSDDDDDDHYYYGRGGIWVDDDSVDHWVDRRQDNIDHALDNQRERIENRDDRARDRQEFRQDWARDNPDKVNKENLSAAANKRKEAVSSAQSRLDTRSTANRQARVEQARSYSAPTSRASTSSRASTWSSQGGSAYANRSASRGMASRSSAGSYGRGGGGGFRGGGGGRRR